MNKSTNLTLKILALLFLAAFSTLMIKIVLLPTGSPFGRFDTDILNFTRQIRNEYLTRAFKFITSLGSTAFLVTCGAVLVLFTKLRRNYGFAVVLPLASAAFLNTALKLLVCRSRPSVLPHLVNEISNSFPSGHTTSSIVFYLLMSYFTYQLAKKQKNRTSKIILKVLCIIFSTLPFLIGASRIYLGVHYPSDVLAGIFLGLFFVLATIGFLPYFRDFKSLLPSKK